MRVLAACFVSLILLLALVAGCSNGSGGGSNAVAPGDQPLFSGGISGYSGMNGVTCTDCHNPNGSLPTVSLTGPSSLTAGDVGNYTLTMTPTAPTDGVRGGLGVAVNGGTLLVISGQGTRITNGEITHSSAKAGPGGAPISWDFQWRAPTSAGTYRMYAASVSGNGTSGSNGDETGTTTADITVTAGNAPPVANAGPDQTVVDTDNSGSEMVTLDGSNSTDDGTIVSWVWSENSVDIASGETAMVDLAVGTHTITLTVTDDGSLTDTDQVIVTVEAGAGGNQAPVANAGPDQTVVDSDNNGSESVMLDGSNSTDDGTIVSWVWTESSVEIANGETATVDLSVGPHTITLTVTDDGGLSDTDDVMVMVQAAPGSTDGMALYNTNCASCHGDPTSSDPAPGAERKVAGARTCSIDGAIYGTAVYPDGVPEMQHLQGALSDDDISAISDYLNSFDVTGAARYETACAGCHGMGGYGGIVHESVRGAGMGETVEAIREEREMRFLSCLPESDVAAIAEFLKGNAGGDDHHDGDHHGDDDEDGEHGDDHAHHDKDDDHGDHNGDDHGGHEGGEGGGCHR